ncbi:MAG: transcriptional regulator [Sphingobacteriales bacterium]|nr:MAG: transcriptional regulator [Sphingobacteriales bacterium]
MANKLTSMQTLRIILQLVDRSLSGRAIARQLGLSRNTVSHYLKQIQATQQPTHILQALDDAELAKVLYPTNAVAVAEDSRHDEFCKLVPYFLAELKRTGVTRYLLWKEYLAKTPDGYRYSQFCFHLNEQRAVVSPSFRNHYKPAELMMVDFAGDLIPYINKYTGEQIACLCLFAYCPIATLPMPKPCPTQPCPF